MTKIAFIGAGSTIFLKNIVGDALCFESLREAEFALMDINAVRLAESRAVVDVLIRDAGAGAQVSVHDDMERAIAGADFVVTMFQIGGYEPATVIDFEVPRRFGVRQTIGDTLGVAGIMRGLRTAPELIRVARAMRRLCPEAWLINYANPMAICIGALARACPDIKAMGLCHSVQNTVQELAHDLELPEESLRYRVAGVNHVAFFLELTDATGRDLYPDLRAGYAQGRLPKQPLLMPRCANKVRYEVMQHFGYFCTESSEHLAEYLPWFIKQGRDDLIEAFAIPLDEYPKRCIEQQADWAEQARALTSGAPLHHRKSHEMGADIINALLTDQPLKTYINLANRGQIPQLGAGLAVETPCVVDASGVQPVVVTDLPAQLRAIIQSQTAVQELAIDGIVGETLEPIFQAAKLDPHTSAELDLRQIDRLVREMLERHDAHGLLPAFIAPALSERPEV